MTTSVMNSVLEIRSRTLEVEGMSQILRDDLVYAIVTCIPVSREHLEELAASDAPH